MIFQNIKCYLAHCKQFRTQYPQEFKVWELIRFFRAWRHSLNPNLNPLIDEQPWIAFAAIDFLKRILAEDMRVFEYGSGGSTLFFARRVKEVISVEHDKGWSEKVILVMEQRGYKNWQCRIIEPTPSALPISGDASDPDAYISSGKEFGNRSFKDYVTSIDSYPDRYFDIILIDGRARPSCFKHSLRKIKYNGWIIWDNTDRKYYWPVMSTAPNTLRSKHCFGPVLCVDFFIRTTFWQFMQ